VLSACFHSGRAWEQNQWSFLFSNFGVVDIFEVGRDANHSKIYQTTTPLAELRDLTVSRSSVLMQPKTARYIPGLVSLVDFTHPDDAIYIFGHSHENISAEDFDKPPAHIVYIPTDAHEMYGHVAGYITLYDRMSKRGGFG